MSGPIQKAVATANVVSQRGALDWFFTHIQNISNRAHNRMSKSVFNPYHSKEPFIGGMFFFVYDPKHKDTLPYYDKFPLVIPVSMYEDGFLGLNLHYLPPAMRGILLDKLMQYKTKATTPNLYMRLSYKLLQAAVSSRWFEPCIHRYLTSHIRSDLIIVQPEYWAKAALLPVQQFEKSGARAVWNRSKRKR